jgi:hypothetical protein
MKVLRFAVFETLKAADVAQASDGVWASPPSGIKILATYVCQGMPFSDQPRNTLVSIQVLEAESNEAIAATQYPVALAGATVNDVLVLELPVAGAVAEEKKYRG